MTKKQKAEIKKHYIAIKKRSNKHRLMASQYGAKHCVKQYNEDYYNIIKERKQHD